MQVIQLLILTIVLVLIAVLALSVKLIFTKTGEFRGGSCQKQPDNLKNKESSCGCYSEVSCD